MLHAILYIYIYTSASGLLGEEALLRDWQRPKYKWGLDVDNFLFPSDHGKFTREKKKKNFSHALTLYGRCTTFSFPLQPKNCGHFQ